MGTLTLKNISFGYRKNQTILNNVSVTIPQGQYVAILGHNGSGKSTLAKCIMGLVAIDQGTISLDDMVLSADNVYAFREHLAIVFQNPDNQFIGATVQDDIAFGLENREIASEAMPAMIQEAAKQVGMLDFLEHEPSKLSGGQKQRVAIAGALAMQPEIVIFDEATSMLDPKGKFEVNALVHELKQTGSTIISITHDVEEAKHADRILVMEKGRIVLDGTPQEILMQRKKLVALQLDAPFSVRVAEALGVKPDFDLETVVSAAWQSK